MVREEIDRRQVGDHWKEGLGLKEGDGKRLKSGMVIIADFSLLQWST